MRDFLDKVKEVFEREWSGEEKVLIMLCCVIIMNLQMITGQMTKSRIKSKKY